MSEPWILPALFCAYLLSSSVVTVYVARRDDLERSTKIAQSVLVWLLPFIGAFAFYALNRAHDREERRPGPHGNDPGSFGDPVHSGGTEGGD